MEAFSETNQHSPRVRLARRPASNKNDSRKRDRLPGRLAAAIKAIKRHWVVAGLIAVAAVVVGTANFVDAFAKLRQTVSWPSRFFGAQQRDIRSQPYVWPAAFTGGLTSDGSFVPGEPQLGKPYYVNVEFENGGHVPALDVRAHTYLVRGEDAALLLDKVFQSSVPESTGSVLAPGARHFQTAVTLDKPPMIYPARITAWDDSWPMIVCGVIVYRSHRRESSSTRYCRQYLRGTRGLSWRSIDGKERIE